MLIVPISEFTRFETVDYRMKITGADISLPQRFIVIVASRANYFAAV